MSSALKIPAATAPGTSFKADYSMIVIATRDMTNISPTVMPGDHLYVKTAPRPNESGLYVLSIGQELFVLRAAVRGGGDHVTWFHDEACKHPAAKWLAKRSELWTVSVLGRVVFRGRDL